MQELLVERESEVKHDRNTTDTKATRAPRPAPASSSMPGCAPAPALTPRPAPMLPLAPVSKGQATDSRKRPGPGAGPESRKKPNRSTTKPWRGGKRRGQGRKPGSKKKNAGYPKLHLLKTRKKSDPPWGIHGCRW